MLCDQQLGELIVTAAQQGQQLCCSLLHQQYRVFDSTTLQGDGQGHSHSQNLLNWKVFGRYMSSARILLHIVRHTQGTC
jgi:hypothetical protein